MQARRKRQKNNGDDIWHELASRYENVILVLSGHISASDIVYRKDYGDNGNTVYQMLMDFQTMDTKYSRTTGMVAMFYFTKDGNVVNVEYISTYRTLEAQANNPEAKDIVFRPALNSFSIEYPTELGVGEECEYGTISPTYADEETYPVLLFKNDKTFIGGFYDLNRALESIVSVYNDKDGSYVIYMRGDTVDTGEVDVVSFGSFGGELLIDLNGTTVTNRRTNYLMNFTFSGDSGKHPKITIKDGALVKDGNTLGLIKFDYAASLTKDAYCDITLDNVTLRSLVNYNKNTSVTFVTYEGGWGTATATVNVNAVFNNCTFDFTGSINKAVMIPMRHYYYTDKDQVVMQTTVRGGTAIAETASEFASYISIANGDTNGRADSIKFGRNSDGSYINLVLPASATAPTASFTGADGESCVFNQISSTDESVTYSLINADALKTKYSTIAAEYENAELYPVALFRKDSSAYTFIGAYSNFNSATAALTYNKTYVLLLRNNTTSSSVCKMDSFTGNYTVDLNGYTLTQTAGDLFSINRTNANSNPLTVSKYFTLNFTNGTIINNADRPIVAVNYGSGSKASAQSYSISVNFDDVTFKSTNNDRAIFANWESGYSKANAALKVIVNATFNDCTFDYTGVGSSFVMIDMGDDGKNAAYNRTVYNVTINGGTIISPKAFDKSDFLYMNENTSTTVTGTDGDITINWGDTVTFGKNEKGEYITLTLPSTVAAPSAEEIYSNASGVDCIFAKSYESEGKTVYRIRPVATVGIDFTPKMSLTLDRNLILNLYIPVKDFLASFTVGEDSYESFSELKTVTIDGTDYYHIALSLDAKAAAADAVLKAKITVGDKTATATFTFGVVKYAEKLILDGSEIEKALARDVLAYIRAAYTYFGTSDDEKMARIAAILDEGYDENNAPVIEGSTSGEASGLASATFVLDGTPAMRFYLPEGANAGKYAFYIGGTCVKTETAADGTYIDIDVYAYALCETVTYTIDGTASGSFHINAYYEWAKTQNDANLVDLVECFWKYLQSARAYRSSILGN